ncbi:MAG: DUF115 domain-containing protein [Treponema sp.]
MSYDEQEKPRLVPTGRGFSVLYRNKYLYSKYTPARSMTTQADALHIPDSTLILCFSPVLGYGLKELIGKLPPSSFILAVECDQVLMRFSLDQCGTAPFSHPQLSYIRAGAVPEVLQKIETLPLFPFKKCISIICSGGALLYKDFYDRVQHYAEELITRFWINRLTLIQLGRNYAHNTFRNLLFLQKGACSSILSGTARITKPVLVAGAGPSLDASRDFIIRNRDRFFLLAVDAAAGALLPDIRPDAVILVESQYWIDAAFIGLKQAGIPLFADLTASPRAVRAAGGKVYFFCTDYARLRYLKRLYGVLNPLILPPMGSVGLTALRLSAELSESGLPIFHTGLDFSWGRGFTHARESSPVKKLSAESGRTASLYKLNLPAGAQQVGGKQGLACWTSPVLAGYADLYRHVFAADDRIADIGTSGINLRNKVISTVEAEQLLAGAVRGETDRAGFAASPAAARQEDISAYLAAEYEELRVLEAHLCGKSTIPQERMTGIIAERDYLYGHFPDAARGYSLDLGFLKRLRIELAYMLKILG